MSRLSISFIKTLIISVSLCFVGVSTASAANLWAGEEIRSGAGYPAITKFYKGDPEKPLLVFVPGAHHSARIAYGGHSGSRNEDFLAHWLTKEGYNFLAISYPIETKSAAMDSTHPDFTTRAWGKQAAEISQKIITEHGLKGRVIVLGWSMAGKVAQPYYEAAKEIGLDMDFFVSLAATPPLPGIITMNMKVSMAPSGLADRSTTVPKWFKHIKANEADNGGKTIIPWEAFESEYTGNISIQQQGYGLRYKEGASEFVRDHWADLLDTKGYDYGNFPLVAMVLPMSTMDTRHTLTDPAAWSVYIGNKIFKDYGSKTDMKKLTEPKLQALAKLTLSAPERLATTVTGNHFFFVGESGAKATAEAIRTLEQRVRSFKNELSTVLGITIQ